MLNKLIQQYNYIKKKFLSVISNKNEEDEDDVEEYSVKGEQEEQEIETIFVE